MAATSRHLNASQLLSRLCYSHVCAAPEVVGVRLPRKLKKRLKSGVLAALGEKIDTAGLPHARRRMLIKHGWVAFIRFKMREAVNRRLDEIHDTCLDVITTETDREILRTMKIAAGQL